MAYSTDKLFLISYFLVYCVPAFSANLRVVHQWEKLDFRFPSEDARQHAINKGYYVPGASVPLDVDVQNYGGKSRTFVSVPRFGKGRPVTLGTVDKNSFITAYPEYHWHDNQENNCDGMTSIFRLAIDRCNRLWAIDSGRIGATQVCPPQLLAFDLNTDKLVYRHKFDASKYIPVTSLFITPVVDVRGHIPNDCSDTFVYVADAKGHALLVVDVANDRSWRLEHSSFEPVPTYTNFSIDGEKFILSDGILGMALSPYKPLMQDRLLYFHGLATVQESVVRTSLLRNVSFIYNSTVNPDSIITFPEERPNQSAAEAMDNNGIMYFGLMDPPSIWCWNTATEFRTANFHPIAIDQETLQFASGVKIVNNRSGQELWVTTISYQRVQTGSINQFKRINFRIHTEKLSVLLKKSPCLIKSN